MQAGMASNETRRTTPPASRDRETNEGRFREEAAFVIPSP
jgi:hypothetical protein